MGAIDGRIDFGNPLAIGKLFAQLIAYSKQAPTLQEDSSHLKRGLFQFAQMTAGTLGLPPIALGGLHLLLAQLASADETTLHLWTQGALTQVHAWLDEDADQSARDLAQLAASLRTPLETPTDDAAATVSTPASVGDHPGSPAGPRSAPRRVGQRKKHAGGTPDRALDAGA